MGQSRASIVNRDTDGTAAAGLGASVAGAQVPNVPIEARALGRRGLA
jgi:hypothetical protein